MYSTSEKDLFSVLTYFLLNVRKMKKNGGKVENTNKTFLSKWLQSNIWDNKNTREKLSSMPYLIQTKWRAELGTPKVLLNFGKP